MGKWSLRLRPSCVRRSVSSSERLGAENSSKEMQAGRLDFGACALITSKCFSFFTNFDYIPLSDKSVSRFF